MNQINEVVKGDKQQYFDMMSHLDKDGNGLIDYTEFITGAIDKFTLLSKENLTAIF